MNINDFIKKLETEFEGYETGEITPNSSFKDLKNWSSVHALILVALAEAEYGVDLDANDLKSATTVSDLFNVIEKKKA
jgi:acyl carrier protein